MDKKTKRDQRPSVYIAENTYRVIGPYDKGELSGRINEILDRYGEIIKRADFELTGIHVKGVDAPGIFTEDEINVVASVIQGTLWQPAALIDGGIVADMEDAESDYYASPTARALLIAKVRGLTYAQQVALVERSRRISRRGEK